mmetsp:Transcript_52353/g.104916  ORF Transcript_52353/g.104916 Transcript_52353/m.104916 type:complete len:199 (+) Transcript_52353:175-771(+)
MNHVVYRVTETELPRQGLEESVKALIHTILFGRWPTEVRPLEAMMNHWPVSYAIVGEAQKLVNDSLLELADSLIPAGPELLKGSVSVTFHKRRTNKVVFWSYEERIVWEEWVIPILVNTSSLGDGRISLDESRALQRANDSRYADSLQQRLMEVAILLNDSVDHVPPVSEGSHEIEVVCVQREREAYPRVMAAPPVDV